MSGPLPEGFSAGHWTDLDAGTGCTVVLAPERGAVASADVRGGGTSTRDVELLDPAANAADINAVLLTGGSGFGLAAADGVMRWLERRERGFKTPGGIVPRVPAAVIYDLVVGDASRRPGPDEGEAACEAASRDPGLGSVGAGAGAAVGKVLGRESSAKSGVGIAAQQLPSGGSMTALAVVNAFGDVIGADGGVLAGPRRDGKVIRTAELLRHEPFKWSDGRDEDGGNTTLVCVMTDAEIDKTGCAIVAKMANAGMARAVDPVNSAVDGDVVFCLASASAGPCDSLIGGVIAAALTAEAIRAAV